MKGSNEALIITINYNQNPYTVSCVESILTSDFDDFKILLIDNGSSYENKEQLINKLPDDDRIVCINLENNIGYVGAVNVGLSKAIELNVDYVVTLNNDTLVDKYAISSLIKVSKKHKDEVIVSGKVFNYHKKNYLQTIGNIRIPGGNLFECKPLVKNSCEKDTGQFDEEIWLDMTDDILWCFSQRVLTKVGLYSDFFFLYGEQNDYLLRAVKKGIKIVYTPHSKIWHKGSVTTADGINSRITPRIEYWKTMAAQKLSVLHLTSKQHRIFIFKYLFKLIIRDLFNLIQFKTSYKIIYAHFMAIKHFKFWNKIRYKDNGYNPF